MLSFFRKGGVAQFVVAAVAVGIIVVFVLEFRAGRGQSASWKQECAVEVYGSCIAPKEFQAAFLLVVPRGTPAKEIKKLSLRRQVLEGLVERELLMKEAERLGIAISEDEIDDELMSGRAHVSLPVSQPTLVAQLMLCRPDELGRACDVPFEMVRYLPVKSVQSGAFDIKIYERVIRNTTNRSPKEFKEMQRRELIAKRLRELVQSRARVSDGEAFAAFQRSNSRAVVRTVDIKRNWVAKYAADVSDAAVDRWAFENKEQVDEAWKTGQSAFKADCPLVSEIVQRFEPGSGEDEKVELRKKLEDALVKIKAGSPFGAVARQASSGEHALVGGELGCLEESYGPGAQELLQAAGKLKPGQVSPILESSVGFHIVQFHGKLAAADVEKVGRRQVARKLAVKFLADDLAKKLAGELIEKVKGGAKLEDATAELAARYASKDQSKPKPAAPGVAPKPAPKPAALEDADRPEVDVSPPFDMTLNPIPNAMPTENPAAFAYALEKPGGVHPTPIATTDGVAVLELREKTLAKREDFEKDRAALLRKARKDKEEDAVVRYLAALRKAAEDKVKIDQRFVEDPKDERTE
jgi:peptidyl-prolyl cis-trans isomerase D